jgi:hypothetical protein
MKAIGFLKKGGRWCLVILIASIFVIETNSGYSILRSYNGYKPYEGSIVYGNFSNYGTRDYYDRSSGVVYTFEVIEYWLTYYDAQNAINYYCY